MNPEQASAGIDGPWPVGKILIQRVYRRALAGVSEAFADRAVDAGPSLSSGGKVNQ